MSEELDGEGPEFNEMIREAEAQTRPYAIEESDRQLILLAIADLALSRPGFNDALRRIAVTLNGPKLFEGFKTLNADRVRASHAGL